MEIVVTGSSGKAGWAAAKELLDHGYEVAGVNRAPAPTQIHP